MNIFDHDALFEQIGLSSATFNQQDKQKVHETPLAPMAEVLPPPCDQSRATSNYQQA